ASAATVASAATNEGDRTTVPSSRASTVIATRSDLGFVPSVEATSKRRTSFEEKRLSSKNVALITSAYQALVGGDLVTFLRFLSTDVRIVQPAELPWGGEFRGRSGAKMVFVRLAAYVDAAIDIERLIDAGGRVAAIGRMHGRSKGAGRAFDAPL